MPDLRFPGVWTPWAAVVCLRCHGRKFDRGFGNVKVLDDDDWAGAITARERACDEDGGTFCPQCDRPIWIRDDVALLHNVKLLIDADEDLEASAEMWQTGGMCAALAVQAKVLSDKLDAPDAFYFLAAMDEAPGFSVFRDEAAHESCDDEASVDLEPDATAQDILAAMLAWAR